MPDTKGQEGRWPSRLQLSRATPETRPYVCMGDEAEAVEAHGAEVETYVPASELERYREALERLLKNAEHIFDKQPVRDWGETLAEARAASQLSGPTPNKGGLDAE